MNIGILGANGHVGQSLAHTIKESGIAPFEFSRKNNNFDEWRDCGLDVIINCVGMGSPPGIRAIGSGIFEMSDSIDNQILDYLCDRDIVYIYISSGAIHYRNDCYAISKRCAELKHRAMPNKKIVDLRVFNYLTEYINRADGYLVTEIINSIIDKKTFLTNNIDIRKDFINRYDLWQAIVLCINTPENTAYDLYSRGAVGKFELLDFCNRHYGLQWQNDGDAIPTPQNYIATENNISKYGYKPCWTSLECVDYVINQIVSQY